MRKTGWFVATAVLCAAPAFANVGLPMIVLVWPIAIYALIPVILIEAVIFARAGYRFWWSLKANAVANLVTTLIGIPVTWFALFLLEMGVGYSVWKLGMDAPWLDTVIGNSIVALSSAAWIGGGGYKAAASAYFVLLVFFFVMSWQIEWRIVRNFDIDNDERQISRTSLIANATTYALLALYPAVMFFKPDWLKWLN